jgi:hypothetical protein
MANKFHPKKHEIAGAQIMEFYKSGLISAATAFDELSVSTEDLTTNIKKLQAENSKRFHEEFSKEFVPDPKAPNSDIKISDLPVVKPMDYRYYCETCHKPQHGVEEAADHLEMYPKHTVVTVDAKGFAGLDVMTGKPAELTKPELKIKFGIDFGMTHGEKTSRFLASEGGCPLPVVKKPKPKPKLRPGQRKTLKLP